MVYITTMHRPHSHQMTIEELLFEEFVEKRYLPTDSTSTHTYALDSISETFLDRVNVPYLVNLLKKYNERTDPLRELERESLYYTFHIPKRSGGLRRIDAPEAELKSALRELKELFEKRFGVLYHTAAFAYVRNRSTVSAVKKHQQNQSKWFAKLDLSNFFGSTTPEFIQNMFSMIFPFSEIVKLKEGKEELFKALDLAFLNGGLPQGTPISPLLTNVMMIPIDHALAKQFRDFNKQGFVYTRYADDFIISSRYEFNVKDVEEAVVNTLRKFGAPFTVNEAKTRYGSSSGSNWNLGLMLNRNNDITVGYRAKVQFRHTLHNFARDKRNGVKWPLCDINTTLGLYSYYRMVEGETVERIVAYVNQKENTDVISTMQAELSPC